MLNLGVGGLLRFFKFLFIDNDKKFSSFFLFVLKIEFLRFFRLIGREESKEELKLWFGSYLICIIVLIIFNMMSIIIISIRGRIIFILSEDILFRGIRVKRFEDEEEIRKSNDVIYRRVGGDDEWKVRVYCWVYVVGF